MADLYEKLGDMLNEVLESGKIPEKDINKFQQENQNSQLHDKTCEKSVDAHHENSERISDSSFFKQTNDFTNKNTHKNTNRTIDSVIKNYTYNNEIQFPAEIHDAMKMLQINYPFTKTDLRIKYHEILKALHPDKNDNLTQNEKKPALLDADLLNLNYKLLSDYFFKEK